MGHDDKDIELEDESGNEFDFVEITVDIMIGLVEWVDDVDIKVIITKYREYKMISPAQMKKFI